MNTLPPQVLQLIKGQNDFINTTHQTITHHDVFLDSDIEDPENYRELISLLFNASEGDTIHIFINSNGGSLDSTMAIIEGIKNTHALVTCFLIGACHSGASIITMYCHEVVVLESAYMMCHTASFGSIGMTGNVKSQTDFTVRRVEKLLDNAYEGFLTKDELLKVKQGMELWFDDEDIKKRIESRVKVLTAKFKKLAKDTQNI